ncbi:hypothetical protein V2O64_12910 [Verrucomicrobiaceae bacterium 227]
MSAPRLFAITMALFPGLAFAHHDVSAAIKELDQQIAVQASADLHYQRALEFRALRNTKSAEADLRQALALQPGHRESLAALIQLLHDTPEALALAKSYLADAREPRHQLEARFLIAQVASWSDDDETALATCNEIQKLHPDHTTDLDLLHARLLLQTGNPAKAADILNAARQKHQGIVLRNAWIDASLSAEQTAEVLPIIEKELADSRFHASWLIRRARASLAEDKPAKALPDLHAALAELNTRIQPDRPDLTLIADRGLALVLLGSKDLALRDLATLHKSTLSKSAYAILEAELK